jgi:mevalonate kinase
LGSAINLRARATIEALPGRIEVDARDLMLKGFSIDLRTGRISSDGAMNAVRYVSAVLCEFGADDLRVKVESEIPPAAGLGSSAAIVVATMSALNRHMSIGLTRDDIASQAYKIEKNVQLGMASQMDTALATYGGYLQVGGDVRKVDLPELEMIVGYTERSHDTRKEVQKVQELLKLYPDIVGQIFGAIGAISTRAIPLIREGKLQELGRLMNMNHGLLEAMGVGTRELNDLVYAARGAGSALGAKLTGAGGGGCMIALTRGEGASAIAVAISQAHGRAFPIKTGCEGVRLEG